MTRMTHLMAVAALLASPLAGAATFNTSDLTRHARWQSMRLTLGEEQHARAVETTSYTDAVLSINATQGVCDLPWLEMRVTLETPQQASRTVNLVPTRLRVDEQPIIDTMAEFITERGDDGFYSHFYLGDLTTLTDEMAHGEKLYIGFDQQAQDPWYMTFDLEGAGAALARMQQLCQTLPAP